MSELVECVLCGRRGVQRFEPADATTWRCVNRETCQRRQEARSTLPGLSEPVMAVDEPAPATVAGLAREVEALRRAVDRAVSVAGRVEELAGVVSGLVEDYTAQGEDEPETPVPSWLDFDGGTPDAEVLLGGLVEWLGVVFLRYTDAAAVLPACWLWHPDLVEELLWLMRAWLAAYRVAGAKVSAAADWHDRLRPGVVRRIHATAGACSVENHLPGGDRHAPGPVAPLADAAELVAAWWTADRAGVPPEPGEEHLAAATAVRTRGRSRR